MNEMTFNIIMALNNLVGIYVAIRLYQGVFKKKNISKQRQFRSMLLIFFIFTTLNIINQALEMGIFIAFILYFIIALLMYQGKVHMKIIASIFIIIFSMVTELLTALSFIPLFSVQMNNIRDNLMLLFLGGMISKLLLLVIFEIITRIISKKASLVSTGYWLLIITIPAVSLYLAVAGVYKEVIENEFSLRIVMLCISILYINVIAFYLFDRIVMQIHENNQRRFHEEQLLLQQKQYKSILSGYEQVKKVRHDMKNHLIILESYLNEAKYSAAGKYLEQLQGELNASVKEIISGNVIVDTLINHRKKERGDNTIQLNTSIMIPSQLKKIEDMDLCILLGNALDNAYEACQRILDNTSEKIIRLTMKYSENQLFIQLQNSYDVATFKNKSDQYISSKEDVQMHGLGIGNMKAVVDKYNGILTLQPKEDYFELNIMIQD